jgi:MFS transporter, OFA family, oxalate/formate antiporter
MGLVPKNPRILLLETILLGDYRMSETSSNRGWVVTFAGTGINLALGILYTWSVIKGGMPESWGWTNADKALPYSVACIVFALAMIPAGRLQDKIGPRWVATIGGVLTGLGCILAGLSGSSLAGFVVGFGVLAGIGIGFGYASATPPAVKWFPPQKTGLIAGLVVAGFGLASVYIAPLANWMLNAFGTTMPDGTVEKGVSQLMIIFGIAFLIIVTLLAQLLRNPPEGYVPPVAKNADGTAKATVVNVDRTSKEMLKTPQFYILWLMYFAGAAAGLTFISVAAGLGKASLGEKAFIAVAVLAVGNAGGRIIAGIISDKIGRQWTLFTFMILQALVVGILYFVQAGAGVVVMMLLVLAIGANYGSNLALFPSAAKDYFGLKNFGSNYGVLFTAWGAAGMIMPFVNGTIMDVTGSKDISFFIIIAMLLAAAGLSFVSRAIAEKDQAAEASAIDGAQATA